MKDDDYIEHLFVCSTHDYLLFFTNRGKVYRSKVYELPEAGRTSKGRYLGNVLPLREGERVQSVLATRDFSESEYLVFATRSGTVKKTEFQAYNTPIKADGIIAINIRDDDELVAVRRVDAGDEVLMVSQRRPDRALLARTTRARWAATPAACAAWTSPATTTTCSRWTSRATTSTCSSSPRTASASARWSTTTARPAAAPRASRRSSRPRPRAALAGALVVREHQQLVFISQNGMVQRIAVRGIRRSAATPRASG